MFKRPELPWCHLIKYFFFFFSCQGDDPNKYINPVITGLFGAVAGAASVFGNTPVDVIKTRMQVSDRTSLYLYSWD